MRAPIKTFARARKLRREMTRPEVVLWQKLRQGQRTGLRFRRQHPVGPYILDFYCPSARLAIEIDGLVHDNAAQARRDARRSSWLADQDVTVLRLTAPDILSDEKLEGALIAIEQAAAGAVAPSDALRAPPPPLAGEEPSHEVPGRIPSAADTPATSETYRLFEQAMVERRQIVCTYGGYRRELCPIILGHTKGEEKALTFQFGGESRSGLPPGGEWRCLFLANVADVRLRKGRWHAGDSHRQPSSCVDEVDLDANPDSPYNPKRRLTSGR